MTPGLLLSVAATLLATAGEPARPTVQVKGSDTIGGELGPALARAFEATSPGVTVHWEALGSATAFVGLLDGTADVGASSRPVNAQELERAKAAGLELREFVLGYDGIAVIVHPSNPVRHLTIEQLSALFTGKVASWSELGGKDLKPALFGRPTYSGTHAFFQEKVLRRGDKKATDEFGPGTTYLEHSQAIVAAVAADPAAVGYVGMGWVKAGVSALGVGATAAGPFVKPTTAAVHKGTYPVYRPLLLYTRGEPRGEVRRLLQYILAGDGRRLVATHDFTPGDVPATIQRTAPASPAPAPAPSQAGVRHVYFGPGKAAVDAEAEAALALIAREVGRSSARVHVIGHSDSSGAPELNSRLAWSRAAAAADVLVRRGLRPEDLLIEVRGADAPVATNDTPAGRRANRRVDVEIVRER